MVKSFRYQKKKNEKKMVFYNLSDNDRRSYETGDWKF